MKLANPILLSLAVWTSVSCSAANGRRPGSAPQDPGPASAGSAEVGELRGVVVSARGEPVANAVVYVSDDLVREVSGYVPGVVLEERIVLSAAQEGPVFAAVTTGHRVYVDFADPEPPHTLHVLDRRQPGRAAVAGVSRLHFVEVFPTPEVFVELACDIHPQEQAYVAVLGDIYYDLTDEAGRFRVPAGPRPGAYVVYAAHPQLGQASRCVELGGGAPAPVDLQLAIPEGTQ